MSGETVIFSADAKLGAVPTKRAIRNMY